MKFSEVEWAMFGDHSFGRAKATGAPFLTIRSVYQAEDESNVRFSQLQRRQLIKQDNVVQLLDLSRDTKRSLCSKTFHITATFEYTENYLKKELIRRRKAKNPFNELELTRVFFDVVEGYGALQKSGVKLGEINPMLVWVWEDPAMKLPRAKVIERLNLSKDARANIINTITAGMDLYAEPLAFVSLVNNNQKALNEVDNWGKIDIFSLGLVMLEAGLLESVQSLYDANKGVFNHEKLSFFLKKFYMLYGDSSLVSLWVTRLLRPDWRQRPDFLEVKVGLPNWYQVKVAIDVGHMDGVGTSGFGNGNGPSNSEGDSKMTYEGSQISSPPIQLSLTEPRGTTPQASGGRQLHNDFEFDHRRFTPIPGEIMLPESQKNLQVNTPFNEPLPDDLPEEYPDSQEPSFDFFGSKNGGSGKTAAIQAYANKVPETGISALNFSSFKLVSVPGKDDPVLGDPHGGVLPTETYVTEGDENTPKLDPFKEAQIYAEIDGQRPFNEQVRGYINPPNNLKPPLTPNLEPENPNRYSLVSGNLLSIIDEKQDKYFLSQHTHPPQGTLPIPSPYVIQTNPENLNFSVSEPDSFFEGQGAGIVGRKPVNDFRSGLSDMGFGNSNPTVHPENKMNLSSYLKNMK